MITHEQQEITTTVDETAVQDLGSRLRGELLRPSSKGYEQARRVYNGMIDKHQR